MDDDDMEPNYTQSYQMDTNFDNESEPKRPLKKCVRRESALCFTNYKIAGNFKKIFQSGVEKDISNKDSNDSTTSKESQVLSLRPDPKDDIEKCVKFWEKIMQENLEPIRCTLIKNRKQRKGSKADGSELHMGKEEVLRLREALNSAQETEEKMKNIFIKAVTQMQRSKLDKLKIQAKVKCPQCKIVSERFDDDGCMVNKLDDIIALNDWKSVRKTECPDIWSKSEDKKVDSALNVETAGISDIINEKEKAGKYKEWRTANRKICECNYLPDCICNTYNVLSKESVKCDETMEDEENKGAEEEQEQEVEICENEEEKEEEKEDEFEEPDYEREIPADYVTASPTLSDTETAVVPQSDQIFSVPSDVPDKDSGLLVVAEKLSIASSLADAAFEKEIAVEDYSLPGGEPAEEGMFPEISLIESIYQPPSTMNAMQQNTYEINENIADYNNANVVEQVSHVERVLSEEIESEKRVQKVMSIMRHEMSTRAEKPILLEEQCTCGMKPCDCPKRYMRIEHPELSNTDLPTAPNIQTVSIAAATSSLELYNHLRVAGMTDSFERIEQEAELFKDEDNKQQKTIDAEQDELYGGTRQINTSFINPVTGERIYIEPQFYEDTDMPPVPEYIQHHGSILAHKPSMELVKYKILRQKSKNSPQDVESPPESKIAVPDPNALPTQTNKNSTATAGEVPYDEDPNDVFSNVNLEYYSKSATNDVTGPNSNNQMLTTARVSVNNAFKKKYDKTPINKLPGFLNKSIQQQKYKLLEKNFPKYDAQKLSETTIKTLELNKKIRQQSLLKTTTQPLQRFQLYRTTVEQDNLEEGIPVSEKDLSHNKNIIENEDGRKTCVCGFCDCTCYKSESKPLPSLASIKTKKIRESESEIQKPKEITCLCGYVDCSCTKSEENLQKTLKEMDTDDNYNVRMQHNNQYDPNTRGRYTSSQQQQAQSSFNSTRKQDSSLHQNKNELSKDSTTRQECDKIPNVPLCNNTKVVQDETHRYYVQESSTEAPVLNFSSRKLPPFKSNPSKSNDRTKNSAVKEIWHSRMTTDEKKKELFKTGKKKTNGILLKNDLAQKTVPLNIASAKKVSKKNTNLTVNKNVLKKEEQQTCQLTGSSKQEPKENDFSSRSSSDFYSNFYKKSSWKPLEQKESKQFRRIAKETVSEATILTLSEEPDIVKDKMGQLYYCSMCASFTSQCDHKTKRKNNKTK